MQSFTFSAMNYGQSIKQRPGEIKSSMGVDTPPIDYSTHAMLTARTQLEISAPDSALLESGDKAAMRDRVAQLQAMEIELDATIKSNRRRARSYHVAAVRAHEKR